MKAPNAFHWEGAPSLADKNPQSFRPSVPRRQVMPAQKVNSKSRNPTANISERVRVG